MRINVKGNKLTMYLNPMEGKYFYNVKKKFNLDYEGLQKIPKKI